MRQLSLNMGGSPFGAYRVRIDPWEVDYGNQTPLASDAEQGREEVDLGVEVEEASWAPIRPGGVDRGAQQRVIFIDGVRRLEARLQVLRGSRLIHGAFGCYAVGAVELAPGSASFGELEVWRVVVLGAGELLPKPVQVRPELTYQPASTKHVEVDAPLRHIQDAMRAAEARLAAQLCSQDALIIVDGPLTFDAGGHQLALGYIKRIHQLYLPVELFPMLARLPAGARTPLFRIRPEGSGFVRYSWFQRLAEPGPGASDLHGLVRLEASAKLGLEVAKELANAATVWLPRVAPPRARDPRSPQNLLPIGALERKLRAASGDAALMRRWIETLVVQEALHG
jgi:uncharacterized protein